MQWPKDIVLVGAGNVAWHLGHRLRTCGLSPKYVHSRSLASAEALGESLGCPFGTVMSRIPKTADLYLLLVPDAAIEATAKELGVQLSAAAAMVMHTSGATPATVLAPYFKHYGVFYPLQTFSRGREIDFSAVPLCLYTATVEDYPKVEGLAKQLVQQVYAVNDQQRAQLHLAAVFVNNFTNYLQYLGQQLAQEHELPRLLLQPLLRETIAKLDTLTPAEAQTGPAIRGDEPTLQRHLALLKDHPQWAALYQQLSKGIQENLGN